MYLRKLTIENIRALKRFEMTFPEAPAGWHVIIGDNGAGKSTLIRAISLGLIGPNEVRAANPNFSEWLRKDAKKGFVELDITWDKEYDFTKGLGKARSLTAKVLLQPSHSLGGFTAAPPMVEAVADERVKQTPDKFLWSSTTKGWFSAGFGPFRRFTGGDTEHDKVYQSSPRCGAHLSVFGEDVALTEALRWLQEIDYQQLKAREKKARQDTYALALTDKNSLSTSSEAELLDEVKTLWEMSSRLQKNSLFKEAELLLRQALALTEKATGPDHPNVAVSLNNLASLLQDTNRLNEAESLVRRALAIAEASYGPDHPEVATNLSNLSSLLQETNSLSEAELLARRALAINEASLGPDHPNVATSLGNLAAILRAAGQPTEALTLMSRALAIDEASYGPNHSDVAISLNNLASLLQETNHFSEAEPLLRRALAITEASLGPNHPKVAIRLNNLAYLLQETNRVGEAEPLIRRALAIAEASLGPDHPSVATSLSNLAFLLQSNNRLDEAEPLLRRALSIDEASFGPDHPTVAVDLNNLASILQEGRRISEAEPLMRRALAISEASLGPNHPSVATTLNNLATILQVTGRLDEAELFIRRALSITELSFGPDHPSVAIRLNNLASILKDTNKIIESEPLMRRALAIDEASFGPDHPKVASRLNSLASLLQITNREEEARALIQKYELKRAALPVRTTVKASAAPKLPINENDWLALRLRTFINESKLLPLGTEFKEMSTEGPIFRDGNGQVVAVTQLSDGFRSILSLSFELIRQLIRVYGLIAVFPPDGTHGSIELPGVVLIDEVDTHLHPTWQARIGQWFTKCFPQIQFIVTTHSPLICRAVTETTGSIWRLPTPGQGQQAEEVTGAEKQRLRLGTVLAVEATALLAERARLSAKEAVGKATATERARLRELQQLFLSVDAEVEY